MYMGQIPMYQVEIEIDGEGELREGLDKEAQRELYDEVISYWW